MPTYDYRCLSCKKVFEAFQKITDKSLDKCIYCSGKVKRLISPGLGVIFKGSGFYETDYKRKKQPASGQDKKDQCKSCPDGQCSQGK